MINKPDAEKLLNKCANRYQLVIAVSKRARQIIKGNLPMIDTKEKSEVTIAALELGKNLYWINE